MQDAPAVVDKPYMGITHIPFTAEQLLGIDVGNHNHPNNPGPGGDFERNVGRINGLSAADLVDVRVNPYLGANFARGTATRLEALIDRMRALPEFDISAAENLDSLANTVLHAHALTKRRVSPVTIVAGGKCRIQLLASVEVLVQFEIVPEERVEVLRSLGHSHLALAQGLHGLAQLFHEVWQQAAGRTPVTLELLDHAVELADRILVSVRGGQIECDELTPGLTPKQVCQRAWTLLVNAYAECRRGIVFLEGEEVADEIAPSLVSAVRRSRSGGSVEDEDEDVEGDEDGADEATTGGEGVGVPPSAS